jgi:hypothetical protein
MPLALSDSRWKDLNGSYGGTDDIVSWLGEAYTQGLSSDRLGELINEVQHQGDTSTAMYAVATHLITLASGLQPNAKLHLLIQAGLIYADSSKPRAVSCPDFLRDEFQSSAALGANALAPLLPQASDLDEFKCAVAALAGFTGHHGLGRFLWGLDYFKGRFYHASIGDKPFPEE